MVFNLCEHADMVIQKLDDCFKCSGRISHFRFRVISSSRDECYKKAQTLLSNQMFKRLEISHDS